MHTEAPSKFADDTYIAMGLIMIMFVICYVFSFVLKLSDKFRENIIGFC